MKGEDKKVDQRRRVGKVPRGNAPVLSKSSGSHATGAELQLGAKVPGTEMMPLFAHPFTHHFAPGPTEGQPHSGHSVNIYLLNEWQKWYY